MPIDTAKTGAAISAHRQRMNLSQQALAGLMNVTHQAVSKWEKGLALPDTETLLALAKLFGTTMEDLLTGVLPTEPEPAEEPAPVQESIEEERSASIPEAELGDLDFSSVMNMLPFVSTKVADHLFHACAKNAQLDARALLSIAPFVSTRTLSDYITTHAFHADSPEVLASLAPFLPAKTVDEMILRLETPLPPHVVQTLLPFASTRVVDQMVMGKLGMQQHGPVSANEEAVALKASIQTMVHQTVQKALGTSGISPRKRLVQKAIETGRFELLEDCFDELDSQTYRLLLNALKETGDAKLLQMVCEKAGELDGNAQLDLAQLLLEGKCYSELAEAVEEMDEDVQHHLLDQAFQENDEELLHILHEHLK